MSLHFNAIKNWKDLAPFRRITRRLSFSPRDTAISFISFLAGLTALALGGALLVNNDLEYLAIPFLVGLCVAQQLLFVDIYRQHQRWDLKVGGLLLATLACVVCLYLLPEYWTGLQINGVIHKSFFGALFLFAVSLPSLCFSLYYGLGATPTAEDISRYPLILVPVLLAVLVYMALISQLLINGLPNLKWPVLSKPYFNYSYPVQVTVAGGWPKWSSELFQGIGIRNQILGTGLLMLMTTLIALPIGLGAGIYLSEYAGERSARVIRFIITSLRSISLLILGFTAYSIVQLSSNTPLAFLFKGYMFDGFVWRENQGGTFFTGSLVLSLLVIPIITRSVEEGCHSLPLDLREGSMALGASDETTLRRIVLPWSLPNLVTAVLLGCAEAAGDMAVLMFIAGRGDYGVGPFTQVTSLAYLVFDIWWGEKSYKLTMQPYQFTAGVLLVTITVGLGVIALILKRWLMKQHRGS